MSGFVYIWRDRKHNRYYIGSHWGKSNDGYVCSSKWMLRARSRRPWDFKRRILKTITTSRTDLLIEEGRWLEMIKPIELKGIRYYNLQNHQFNHWSTNITPDLKERLKQAGIKRRGWTHSDEYKNRLSKEKKGQPSPMKGKKHSHETIKKMRGKLSPRKGQTHTLEARQKMSQATKGNSRRSCNLYLVTHPNGQTETICNLKEFCRNHQLNRSNLTYRSSGSKGYTAIKIDQRIAACNANINESEYRPIL